MAKRGGFPGGGMPGNMNNLMKQAQTMRVRWKKARKSWKPRNLRQRQEAVRWKSLLPARRKLQR